MIKLEERYLLFGLLHRDDFISRYHMFMRPLIARRQNKITCLIINSEINTYSMLVLGFQLVNLKLKTVRMTVCH